MLAVRDVISVNMTMADGVRLAGDVYRPVGDGRYPILVMRQPYGRKIGSTVVLAHPAWYAAQGYIVLVQDVRGRGGSEGTFRILEDDVADGARTLDLVADLDGSDGHVATYGFSYHGMNQYMALAGALAADTRKPDAMAIVMAAWDVRNHWAYAGNAFRMADGQMWARQMAIGNAVRAGDREMAERLATSTGPLHGGPHPARPKLLEEAARYTHYDDWLTDDPAYWDRVSPHARLAGQSLDVPVLHVGGWHDIMLEGTLAGWRGFAAGAADQGLAIGPWAHIPWGRRTGAFDSGEAAADGIDRDIVAFFDRHLKGIDDGGISPVRLYDSGIAGWRTFDAWPDTDRERFYLTSSGRAGASTVDGRLVDEPSAFIDRLVHDPWRPVPSVGGADGSPGLFADRSAVDDRSDVLTYTGEPIAEALTIAGTCQLSLHVATPRAGFDLSVALSMVRPDGAAIHITGTHFSTMKAPDGPIDLTLRTCCLTVPAGHRLRLSIQAAAYPAFPTNPGTGQRPVDAHVLDAVVTTLILSGSIASPCSIELPILAAPTGDPDAD
jgi:putative CocE/NonD family hydrolase